MAVKEVDRMKPDLQGLSSDTMTTTGIGDGILFHELDTGRVWVFHDGAWVEDLRLIYALGLAGA